MTVSSIEIAKDLVDEIQGNNEQVGSVWEYTNSMDGKKLFAVFTIDQLCDIYESPYVENPKRIWIEGRWTGDYEYVNEID